MNVINIINEKCINKGLLPTIRTYAEEGATIICNNKSHTIATGETYYDFTVPSGATYTITATKEDKTASKDIEVSKVALYECTLAFGIEWTYNFTEIDPTVWTTTGSPTVSISNNIVTVYTAANTAGSLVSVDTVTGKEKTIEVEFTVTGETGSYLENSLCVIPGAIEALRSTYNTTYRTYINGSESDVSPVTSYPQTRKFVLDFTNNIYEFYLNDNLVKTRTDTITLSNFIGKPYLQIEGATWYAHSISISKVSLKVVYK